MKNKHLLMVALSAALFNSCKKDDLQMHIVDRPITISAQVPQKVYTNKVRDFILNAAATAASNGRRTIFFQWTCPIFPAGNSPIILSPSGASTKVDNLHVGKYTFILKAWDAAGNKALAEYQMEVFQDSLQNPPKIVLLPDMVLQLPKNLLELDVSEIIKANPPGRALSFDWYVLASPANSTPVEFIQNGSADIYARIITPGQYRFELELTNELGLTSYDTINLSVLADPLSGMERTYDNLFWDVFDDGWGYSAKVFISVPNIFLDRTSYNTSVSVWNEEKQEWISPELFGWNGNIQGLEIFLNDYAAQMEGKKTRVKVKFL
jgi:hypothetical protein